MFHTAGAVKNAIGVGEHEPELRLEAEKELVKDCHRIIASTAKEKQDLTHYYSCPETISIIPCGVNLDIFRPIDKARALRHLGFNGEKIILFVGRIDPIKGVKNLLTAMSYLKGRMLRLVIIGGDEQSQPEVQKLKSLVQNLRIQHSVAFHGLVEQGILPYFYSAADLCVIPSYYESFGMVALESLACGTPVVAAKVGCLESVIHQGATGYVVGDNAPRRLANKIAQFLSHPNERRKSPETIRASITRFSWSNIADAIVDEYRAVMTDYLARPCQN